MFRAPHRTISADGIIGGGHVVVEGDVSRSHHAALCPTGDRRAGATGSKGAPQRSYSA
jgi:Magnesium chelatase, subunit ChlI